MGSLGVPELIAIFVVALLVFGPRKLPQIGRTIGRALGEFRRASNEFKRTIEDEVAADEIREVERDLREARSGAMPSSAAAERESDSTPQAGEETS